MPAVGFSIGFERIVDLLGDREDAGERAVVLVHDADVSVAELVAVKAALLAQGAENDVQVRVRLEQRPKNLKPLLERAAADGYGEFAFVRHAASASDLEFKPLS